MADVKLNADEIPSFVRTAEKCNSSFGAHAHTSADEHKRTRTRKQTHSHRDAIIKHEFLSFYNVSIKIRIFLKKLDLE